MLEKKNGIKLLTLIGVHSTEEFGEKNAGPCENIENTRIQRGDRSKFLKIPENSRPFIRLYRRRNHNNDT